MDTQYDVVVVGLGAMGAATLYQMAKRKVKVLGIDRFSPPHDQGSSHGATRITRVSVGEGEAYVPLVTNSHRIWRELEQELGVELFEQCGVLIMTSTDVDHPNDFTKNTIEIARKSGIEHEVLTAQEIRKRFPQFAPIRDDAIGYLEPSGGYVRPERCVDAQVTMAKNLGAEVKLGTVVTGIESKDGKVFITTDKNETIVAKKAIVSAGMWNKELLGEPFNRILKICRQKLYWFKLSDPSKFPKNPPSFILKHGASLEDSNYGFPPIPGEGSIKIATHQYTVTTTPEELNRQISAAEVEEMYKEHVAPYMEGVSPEIVDSKVCTYTVTPDGGFIIDDHPKMKGVTVISACSGHGFKHSAGIGQAVARLHVEGSCGIDMTAFSVARFS